MGPKQVWVVVILALGAASACKHRDPLYCDEQTPCLEGYEACDLTAACTELRNTCIPPQDVCWDAGPSSADAGIDGAPQICTPDAFIRCDQNGDVVACNEAGTAEVTLACSSGCSDSAMGCNDCEPSSSICESGTLTVCSSTGAIQSMDECPLGCHSSATRCNDLSPSNGLGIYLDDAPEGPDLVLVDGSTINTETGVVVNGATVVSVPSVLLDAPAGGVEVRVLKVRSFRCGELTVTGGASAPALAIVSDGDVDILGELLLQPTADNVQDAPGGFDGTSPCLGGNMDIDLGSAGAGGAGFGGPGAAGGAAGAVSGQSPGTAAGAATLIPLRGGCQGGTVSNFGTPFVVTSALGGRGGGAIQIATRTRIRVGDGVSAASIQANARGGRYWGTGSGGAGGGSGGAILLEAPVVSIGASSGLGANGGGGSCGTMDGSDGVLGTTPAAGANCSGDDGDGGDGGTVLSAPENGANGTGSNPRGGGGGGAVGRIRINTAGGSYTSDASAIVSPAPSTGTAAVR